MVEAALTSSGKCRSSRYRRKINKYVAYLRVNSHDPFRLNRPSSSSESDEQQPRKGKQRRIGHDAEDHLETCPTYSEDNVTDDNEKITCDRNCGKDDDANTPDDERSEKYDSNSNNDEYATVADEYKAYDSDDNHFMDNDNEISMTGDDSEEHQNEEDSEHEAEKDIECDDEEHELTDYENYHSDSNDEIAGCVGKNLNGQVGQQGQATDGDIDNGGRPFLDHRLDHLTVPLQSKGITAKDHLLANIAISLKYNVPYEMTVDMLKWTDTTVYYSGLPMSKKKLWSALCRDDTAAKRHFYCRDCQDSIGEGSTITRVCSCQNCGPDKPNSRVTYFLEVSLEVQLKELLAIPGIASSLKYRHNREKKNSAAIEDIYDGEEYKKLCQPGEFLENPYNFSYIVNTDGTQVSKSSDADVWPIFIEIVELPPHVRKKHILLAGIWVDDKGPLPNMFFLPFAQEAQVLYRRGIVWKPNGENEVTSRFLPIIFSADSKARYDFLRMTQYNGKYGCTFCYAPGVHLPERGCQAKYPIGNDSALRTDEEIRNMATEAFRTKKKVFGVKGPAALSLLPEFNMASGVVVDSMHNMYLGVFKQHMLMLLTNAGQPWYIGAPKDIAVIDQRMLAIKLPSRVSRRPRSLKYATKFKATEWRNVGYFIPACLQGILRKKFLTHLALLCDAAYTLNKDSLTIKELDEAETALTKYAGRFQKYFGIERMTYNIHLLSHICVSVRNWGPFWVHTTFTFESMNRKIINAITSPNGRALQIYTRFLMTKFIQIASYDSTVSEETRNFISGLLNIGKNCCNHRLEDETNVHLVDSLDNCRQPLAWEHRVLVQAGYECSELREFRKIRVNSVEYRCKGFKSSTTFENCLVSCKEVGFGEIVGIVQFSIDNREVHGLFIQRLLHKGYAFGTKYMSNVAETESIVFVTVNDVQGPAFKVKTVKGMRVIRLPNVWETD